MKRIALLWLAALAFEASACGICIDGKIASCYDHAVVTGAKAKGHAVAFFALKGEIVVKPETQRAVLKAIEALPGVLHGTGRVSLENAALSFAFDPSRTSAETAQRELRAKLQPRRLGVAHLRTL
jgi:hypothetical protein